MPGRKYPLDPLIKLRELQVEDAARELAKTIAERQAAERQRIALEEARARAEEDARTMRDGERGALEKGELRAGDLHRAQAWEIDVAEEHKRLAQHIAAAAQGEAKASEQEEAARKDLASREADADVVDKDKARFDAGEAKRETSKEEEAAAEAWRPRRG